MLGKVRVRFIFLKNEASGNREQRRIFGPNGVGVRRGSRKVLELRNWYPSRNIIGVMESRRIR
jgi:hypothetical protein